MTEQIGSHAFTSWAGRLKLPVWEYTTYRRRGIDDIGILWDAKRAPQSTITTTADSVTPDDLEASYAEIEDTQVQVIDPTGRVVKAHVLRVECSRDVVGNPSSEGAVQVTAVWTLQVLVGA